TGPGARGTTGGSESHRLFSFTVGTRSLLGDQLRDLDRVESGTLAQIIRHDEEDQTLLLRHGLILADPAHEGAVAAGGLERVRHVHDLHPGGRAEQLLGTLRRE